MLGEARGRVQAENTVEFVRDAENGYANALLRWIPRL